jgi:anti-sigma B factor antagonist
MIRLQIEQRTHAGGMEFLLEGDLDVSTCPLLRDRLFRHIHSTPAPAVFLDISGVDTVDAAGVGVLLSALRRASEKEGRLVLVAPPPQVARLLIVAGLRGVFPQYPNREAAGL